MRDQKQEEDRQQNLDRLFHAPQVEDDQHDDRAILRIQLQIAPSQSRQDRPMAEDWRCRRIGRRDQAE